MVKDAIQGSYVPCAHRPLWKFGCYSTAGESAVTSRTELRCSESDMGGERQQTLLLHGLLPTMQSEG